MIVCYSNFISSRGLVNDAFQHIELPIIGNKCVNVQYSNCAASTSCSVEVMCLYGLYHYTEPGCCWQTFSSHWVLRLLPISSSERSMNMQSCLPLQCVCSVYCLPHVTRCTKMVTQLYLTPPQHYLTYLTLIDSTMLCLINLALTYKILIFSIANQLNMATLLHTTGPRLSTTTSDRPNIATSGNHIPATSDIFVSDRFSLLILSFKRYFSPTEVSFHIVRYNIQLIKEDCASFHKDKP